MYDELVKRLSGAAKVKYGARVSVERELLAQAADAIEELIEERDMYLKAMTDEHNRAARLLWDKEHQWIPVTEQLPEKDGTFITAYSKGGVSQNWYMTFHHSGGKWYQNSEDTGEVTHWMPLPEPPKEEAT